jgi:hypothetical protein
MKNFQKLALTALTVASLALTGCLNILEEVTFRKNGSGTYAMTIDMGEMKGMMDMLKNMKPGDLGLDSLGTPGSDSTATDGISVVSPDGKPDGMPANPLGDGNAMSQMGEQLSSVSKSLENVQGLSNVREINDSTNFKFGYSFDFANMAALNKAMKIINKEKYESKAEEVFKYDGKNFERLGAGDLGAEIRKSLAESENSEAEMGMDMVKTFFSDMTYKQVYSFPDQKVRKSSNEISEISADGKTLTIALKPFNEDQQKKKISVGTIVKLK